MSRTIGIAIVIRCPRCGKWKRFGEWIVPTMEQYISACQRMAQNTLVFHDSPCDKHCI